jgi:hypothetical protein
MSAYGLAMRVYGLIMMVLVVLIVVGGCNVFIGAGGWGPTISREVTVTRTYVDYSGSGDNKESHYMVATDEGVFEVGNGILLGLWNADELYGKIQGGKRYRLTTKGNRVVGMFWQEFPYIVQVEPLEDKGTMFAGNGDVGDYVYDMRSNTASLVVIFKDGTRTRFEGK